MSKNDYPQEIDFDSLSPRERAVVDGVVEGYTDEQIAQSLGISVATVNSYWTRIRTKIGSYSRTQIATRYLRREMAKRCAVLETEIASLQSFHDRGKTDRSGQARTELELQNPVHESLRFLALAYIDLAALVVAKTGEILYANPLARALFRAERHALEGLPFWTITEASDGSSCERRLRAFFASTTTRRGVSGLDEEDFALRRDGTRLQILISAHWFDSPEGVLASVSIRPYSTETADAMRAVQDLALIR